MTISKFVQVDPNILIEYIYDDGNLISEPYSIIVNSNSGINCFSSNSSNTNNDTSYQLIPINPTLNQYSRFNYNSFSFIQAQDYPSSIPIRYDKIKVHVPTNYTFDGSLGFYIRAYTLDYNNKNFVDLTNYFYNITDVNQQQTDMQFSSPVLIQNQNQWGKYVEIQIPSVMAVSHQLTAGIASPFTINYNLTNGVGLSTTSPIFVDFCFVESLQYINNGSGAFYSLSSKSSTSFAQSPEFEKFGLTVQKSTQGDYFEIYATYNGTIGEFNEFIQNSIMFGNRYYVTYKIDLYEKNILTMTQNITVTQDFIDVIQYRPIIKYSTTTSIISVTCNLIDSVDNSTITRTAAYGMLQNEVAVFSRWLTKINMGDASNKEVFKMKGIATPNLDSTGLLNTNTQLNIQSSSFVVYGTSYNIVLSDTIANFQGTTWTPDKMLNINIFPYDDTYVFKIIEPATTTNNNNPYQPLDLTQYTNVSLNIISDTKKLSFDVYLASDRNNLAGGSVVFKIPQNKYQDIKKIYSGGFSNFYITGIDNNSVWDIIYTGSFNPWDSTNNVQSLNAQFNTAEASITQLPVSVPFTNKFTLKSLEVKNAILNGQNIHTSVNTSGQPNSKYKNSPDKLNITPTEQRAILLNNLSLKWTPYWSESFTSIAMAYTYQFGYTFSATNSVTGATANAPVNSFKVPGDLRRFAMILQNVGILSNVTADKITGNLTPDTQRQVDYVLGYLKIHGFNPTDIDILTYVANNTDLSSWLLQANNTQYVTKVNYHQSLAPNGGNIPPTKDIYDLVQDIISFDMTQ